jgi:protein SCO1
MRSAQLNFKPMLLCVATLLGVGWGLWEVTQGLRVFTSEGARRLAVQVHPIPWPHVALQNHAGQQLEPSEVCRHGRVRVLDFIYTRCDSVCQSQGSMAAQMARTAVASAMAKQTSGVSVWSISLDSERDTVDDLRRYRQRHQGTLDLPIHEAWQVLRIAQSQEQLLDAFGVVKIPDGLGGWEHNAAWYVLDANCRLVRVFDMDQGEAALAFAQQLL